ncbi:hypothetical protein N7326_07050 [Corynebacterium sp. ES2794-CONJ1]|uniref:hypothetical protein n=1 Tax=unclassified Corynebacterium TaxID=2624378 RepID=UPI002167B991|nr:MULTISPECIES: hypothetical protein [unclassified Corynebacterium]MCS4490318.1 hypothetical protein [Corynebacterium sp. ES2775-CONJ]MCS4532408.1 hypothetical protein [Corynebacterium sp. ES2730-CONJ]MCU9519629.1 hypothetical protein [Corynebacterium sp. ES2794-CONJ1]
MYFFISLTANLVGAIFAGVQFARICTSLTDGGDKDSDLPLLLAYALLAFNIPFLSPVSQNSEATVSLFITLTAISTLVVSRSTK